MAEKTKRYWWLKLREDFFDQTTMKKLRRMAGGDTYTIIYLRMQLLSLRNAGAIYFESVEDSFEEELALRLDEAVEDVQMTVLFLKKHGLLEAISDEESFLPEAVKNIDSESDSAARVRNHRERKKIQTLPCNAAPLQCALPTVTSNTDREEKEKKIKTKKRHLAPKNQKLFDEFWAAYPRKAGKAEALKAWKKINPDAALHSAMLDAVAAHKQSDQWRRDNGQYIPYPATWLNGERWKDEVLPAKLDVHSDLTNPDKYQNLNMEV